MPKNKTMACFILQNNLADRSTDYILRCFRQKFPDKKELFRESDVTNGIRLIRDGYSLENADAESYTDEPTKEGRQSTVNNGSALDFAAYMAKKGSRFTAHEKECILSMVKLAWVV